MDTHLAFPCLPTSAIFFNSSCMLGSELLRLAANRSSMTALRTPTSSGTVSGAGGSPSTGGGVRGATDMALPPPPPPPPLSAALPLPPPLSVVALPPSGAAPPPLCHVTPPPPLPTLRADPSDPRASVGPIAAAAPPAVCGAPPARALAATFAAACVLTMPTRLVFFAGGGRDADALPPERAEPSASPSSSALAT
eukprot:94419-Chlamydomonas_euryale.AAC.2